MTLKKVDRGVACQDKVCTVGSGIGGLSMATSFILGSNVTTVLTVLVSISCKTFVWCYKRAKKLPWGC